MTLDDIIKIATLILIPLITTVLTHIAARRKDQAQNVKAARDAANQVNNSFRDDLMAELKIQREENKELRDKVEQLVRENSEIKANFKALESQLQMRIALFESAHTDLPLPMWLKDPRRHDALFTF